MTVDLYVEYLERCPFSLDELSGIVIFEWADEWWKGKNPMVQDNYIEEHWGITDAYRNPKSGYQAVSELFQSIRTESRGYC